MVWWIASRAEDEKYKGKNGLLRRGVLVLGELVVVLVTLDPPPPSLSVAMVAASPIYRGSGPLPKCRRESIPQRPSLKRDN